MRRRLPRLAICAAIVASAAAAPRSAAAHGRFPAIGQIAFHPSDPDTLVARATFGLLVSRDGGGTWRWICTTVTGARLTEDPTIAVTPDGSMVAALFDGLSRGTSDGCSWSFPDADLTDVVVIDQAQLPGTPETLLAVTSSGGADNLVYRSTDQGVTWDPTGDPIEPILFEAIAVAPSDPMRVYLSGSYPPARDTPRMPFVHRSNDGGATWERLAFADFDETDRNIYVLGVDPANPDHLLMRVKSEGDDRLVRSTDAGTTWSVAATIPDVDAFAWSEDGSMVWIGGDSGTGLYRSDDRGATFTQIDAELEVTCLASRGSELWACGNNYTDGFAIGLSTDGGDTFEKRLLYAEIPGMVECAPDSATTTMCTPELPDLIFDLGLPLDAGVPRPDGSVAPWLDAGPLPDGAAGDAGPGFDAGGGHGGDDGGCSCDSAGGRGPGVPVTAALIVLLVAARIRRGASG